MRTVLSHRALVRMEWVSTCGARRAVPGHSNAEFVPADTMTSSTFSILKQSLKRFLKALYLTTLSTLFWLLHLFDRFSKVSDWAFQLWDIKREGCSRQMCAWKNPLSPLAHPLLIRMTQLPGLQALAPLRWTQLLLPPWDALFSLKALGSSWGFGGKLSRSFHKHSISISILQPSLHRRISWGAF